LEAKQCVCSETQLKHLIGAMTVILQIKKYVSSAISMTNQVKAAAKPKPHQPSPAPPQDTTDTHRKHPTGRDLRKTLRQAFYLLCGTCLAASLMSLNPSQSARAATQEDIDEIKGVLESMGTSVVEESCDEEGLYGYYEYEEDKVDQITMCTNTLTEGDLDEYWETLAHEATHVMQACNDGHVIDDAHIARVYRELKEINESSFKDLRSYKSREKRDEVEARWMELQLPDVVIDLLRQTCASFIQ